MLSPRPATRRRRDGKTVRIGGGTAFVTDSFYGHRALVAAGCDYVVYDCLAELTLASLASDSPSFPEGYSPAFLRELAPHLSDLVNAGTKIVTNWGGLNPPAAAAAMRAELAARGLSARIGVVTGDDVRHRVAEFRAHDVTEMFSGDTLPDQEFASVNAYLGAFPIAAALAGGADIVITGRVVDSALALGPLIQEFGWRADDYDLLAAGTLVGHLTECSTQVTGGTFTDWEAVPDPANIGNPIAECRADGSFVLTKPAGSGGLVSTGTVAEQLIYEVGDPQAYIVPDVVCDFSGVTLMSDGADRVLVDGVRGYPPTNSYKVCATYQQGWRATVAMPIIGINAPHKARRQASAVFERTNAILQDRDCAPLTRTHLDVVGTESAYGPHSRATSAREVVALMSVTHDEIVGPEIFLKEQASCISAMSPGTTISLGAGVGARPLMNVFLFLANRDLFHPAVSVDDQIVPAEPSATNRFDPRQIVRPPDWAFPEDADEGLTVPLISLAWARSGDKGDLFNVGIIAREPRFAPYISAALTAEIVGEWYAHLTSDAPPQVERYVLPGTNAINFVVNNALQGGGTRCLRLDPVAKSMGQLLLEFPVPVSGSISRSLSPTAPCSNSRGRNKQGRNKQGSNDRSAHTEL